MVKLGKTPSSNCFVRFYHSCNLFCGTGTSRTANIGEVAPENVYSDRSFSYLSEVRRQEAEEWIRSSTPREFTRDFIGEENFAKAMVRLREGMVAVVEMSEESQELALQSLVEEIRIKFQVLISEDEARSIFHALLMQGNEFLIWEIKSCPNSI